MNLKNRTLSTEIEYYQKILKAFQNIVAIFKVNSIDLSLFFFVLFLYVGLQGFVAIAYQFRVQL